MLLGTLVVWALTGVVELDSTRKAEASISKAKAKANDLAVEPRLNLTDLISPKIFV